MANKLPDVKTPLTPNQVFEGLYKAWLNLFNTVPKRESLLVLLAQSTLESGAGYKSCHCYNLGNVKSKDGDGRDYTFFACNEILDTPYAQSLAVKNPDTVKITSVNGSTSIVWFYPEHPFCRFRAFSTLEDGCKDYLSVLYKRFNKSWSAVLEGNPTKFVMLLKAQKYFTADLNQYTKNVVSIFSKYQKDQTLNFDDMPIMSEEEAQERLDQIAVKMHEDITEEMKKQ